MSTESKPKKDQTTDSQNLESLVINTGELPTIADFSLKTLWADKMQVLVRGDLPITSLVFMAVHPDGEHTMEVARIQITTQHAKKIAEAISNAIAKSEKSPEESALQ